jgi:beta-glucosidase
VALGKPIVVVLMNGRPLAIPWLNQHIDAILETWFLGNMAGPAIADVLFGKYNPSGKLPITFPRTGGQIPIYYNMKNTGRPFHATNKYTSKYLDVDNAPLYPFGYGLSYTSFEIKNIKIIDSVLTLYDDLIITADIINKGPVSGEEVVQLYITDKVGSLTRPVKELKGFQKILLEPGQSEKIRFEIPIRSFGFHNSNMEYVVEEGAFDIHIGNSSENTITKSIIVQ